MDTDFKASGKIFLMLSKECSVFSYPFRGALEMLNGIKLAVSLRYCGSLPRRVFTLGIGNHLFCKSTLRIYQLASERTGT
jgi:hypothetical protein